MKPIEAKTFDDVANNLVEDNTSTTHFFMSIDGTSITLVKQTVGESASATLEIPKNDFDKFVAWYQNDQPPSQP